MALLAIQNLSAGGNPTFAAATGGGDTIPQGTKAGGWTKGVVLLVRNADASSKTVTVAGMTPVVVAANTGLAVIPVNGIGNPQERAITYSAATSVTVAAVRLA